MKLLRAIASKARFELRTQRFVRQRLAVLNSDPNYDLKKVTTGLSNRTADQADDRSILERIIAAYQKAKSVQSRSASAFNVSNEWLPIYRHKMGAVMDALAAGDLVRVGAMYRNFFRDPCATGLVGLQIDNSKLLSQSRRELHSQLFASDAIHRYNVWKQLMGEGHSPKELQSSNVGNPFGYECDGVFVRTGADYQHYYAQTVGSLIEGRGCVAELGGGYGGFAYFLLRDFPAVGYVDFDLPENMALTAYYLLKNFPDRKVVLYGEGDPVAASCNAGIAVMPSFEILNWPDNKVALAFNSYSLSEMSPEAVDTYIKELTRITSSFLLHVNHAKHAVLTADQFGIDGRGFKLVRREKARWNDGRTADADEDEFLYVRSTAKN